MAEGAPSKKPRPAKSRSRPAFDPRTLPTLDPDGDDEFRRGAKVVAPWVDGHRYSATVVRNFQTTVRVVFFHQDTKSVRGRCGEALHDWDPLHERRNVGAGAKMDAPVEPRTITGRSLKRFGGTSVFRRGSTGTSRQCKLPAASRRPPHARRSVSNIPRIRNPESQQRRRRFQAEAAKRQALPSSSGSQGETRFPGQHKRAGEKERQNAN